MRKLDEQVLTKPPREFYIVINKDVGTLVYTNREDIVHCENEELILVREVYEDYIQG